MPWVKYAIGTFDEVVSQASSYGSAQTLFNVAF